MKAFSLIPAVVLVSACSPLQQAPMIYTSKQVVGIDIAAPTPESSGIVFSIGYKSIDAAYVPLAVSKEGHDIQTISATHGTDARNNGAGHEPKSSSSPEQARKADELKSTIESAEKIEQEATKLEEGESAAKAYNNVVKLQTLTDLDPGISHKLRMLGRPTITASLENGAPIPNPEIRDIEKRRAEAEKELIAITPIAEQARQKLESMESDQKVDAMSVYGSFDSDTDADTPSVSSKLGKVFATGVAAQNLTDGLAHTNRAVAADRFFANCLKLSENFTADEKKAFAQKCSDAFFLMMR